jgi:3D (Asp-Asp-Asp) domain-containing protein
MVVTKRFASLSLLFSALGACSTAGSTWMAEPLPNDDHFQSAAREGPPPPARRSAAQHGPVARRTRLLGETPSAETAGESLDSSASPRPAAGGRSLGTFRNTYYDFPNEAEFDGPTVKLRNASCDVIREVPRGFFETLCVQGSGTLRSGPTVSFAKRDCGCAEICPRTQQRICFDLLDAAAFPWGRGATGKAITPLLTVAVDSNVIPLGTALYVPELDGLPRDVQGTSAHDGCFIAEDRGVKVQGKHVDVFTGHSALTAVWNKLVPSNRGVTVILDSPRCRRN